LRAYVRRVSRRSGLDTYEVRLEDGRGFTLLLGSDREGEVAEHVRLHALALYGVEVGEVEVEGEA